MLRDDEITEAATEVATFRAKADLDRILTRYEKLLEDYRRLKSDYEEERDAREKYKQIARSREQSPFVLVLVDGDGYIFDDVFLDRSGDGGNDAARALHSAITDSLKRKGLNNCQVIMRVYANVMGLSKVMARNGVTGHEARSLAPFVANFNRSFGLTEFVDAGTLKENADFKIRSALNFYAASPQCKHVYFAACHDVGYISDLIPYKGNDEKFTLVRTPGVKFHSEFAKLGMGIEDIKAVFRTTAISDPTASYDRPTTFATIASANPVPIDISNEKGNIGGSIGNKKSNANGNQSKASQSSSKAGKDDSNGSRATCQFYKIGKCRYGKSCKLAHVDETSERPVRQPSEPKDDVIPTWRGKPFLDSDLPLDKIAVNKQGHRIDTYITASADGMAKLKARAKTRRLCNRFHLTGSCDAGSDCEFDHAWIPSDMHNPLQVLSRTMPCPRRGACRNLDCVKGHICQVADCRNRSGRLPCKIPHSAHNENFTVDLFVPGRHLTAEGKSDSISDSDSDGGISGSL